MTVDDVSKTALAMAMSRALHRRRAKQPVLDDPLAEIFPGVADYVAWALDQGEAASTGTPPVMPLARARFFEEVALSALSSTAQIVLLGAGLDTFAHRHSGALGSVAVYEVERAGTQQWKRQALEEAAVRIPNNITYVAADLSTDDLVASLTSAGWQPDRPAVVSWLGVTYYLDEAALLRTLDALALFADGTTLVLDYFRPRDVWDEGMVNGAEIARQRGEPWVTQLTDVAVDDLLSQRGYEVTERLTSRDALRRYPSDLALAANTATVVLSARLAKESQSSIAASA